MKRLFRLIGIILLVVLGFALGFIYSVLPKEKVLLHQDAVVEGLVMPRVELKHDAGQYIDIQSENANTLFIFYPGGLVRPQAYEWLGVALAPLGIRTVIPVFMADLAVTAPNRASALLEGLGNYERVVVGGHSLGGAMAARFVLKQPEKVHGLVLMGAFSAKSDDLSALDVSVLSLAAEHDGLATLEEIRESLRQLPDTARLEIIEGAVHSFFGRYGPQRGDGVPTVTRHEAEMDIVSSLQGFFNTF
jgi:hypothetical protein